MSSAPNRFLHDLVERAGFDWGSAPPILSNDRRDRFLLRGLATVLGGPYLRRRDVSRVLADVFDELTTRVGELEPDRVNRWFINLRFEAFDNPRQMARLALATHVSQEVWRNLIYAILAAHHRWLSNTNAVNQSRVTNEHGPTSIAVRNFLRVAGPRMASGNYDILLNYQLNYGVSIMPALLEWAQTPSEEEEQLEEGQQGQQQQRQREQAN
ncbi:hypothetical protein V8F20_003337 [Naviculisporaceae sp. PSN 640]